jgi:ribosomal protein L24E
MSRKKAPRDIDWTKSSHGLKYTNALGKATDKKQMTA